MNLPETVIPIMRKVRPLVLPHWGNAPIINQKTNSAANIVTQLDIDVEKLVSGELKKAYPDIAFVGEESGGNRDAREFWLMDPIDGTGHFARGLPFCTSMLALIRDGKVVFSVIYDFINDKAYWAELGKGAFCEDERLHVSSRSLKESYICWGARSGKPENERLSRALQERTPIFQSISAGWEFAMVASGKLDAEICFDPYGSDYDYAPGALLISEAGGIVANIGNTEYDYRNTSFIASNPIIYKELTEGDGALFSIK